MGGGRLMLFPLLKALFVYFSFLIHTPPCFPAISVRHCDLCSRHAVTRGFRICFSPLHTPPIVLVSGCMFSEGL